MLMSRFRIGLPTEQAAGACLWLREEQGIAGLCLEPIGSLSVVFEG